MRGWGEGMACQRTGARMLFKRVDMNAGQGEPVWSQFLVWDLANFNNGTLPRLYCKLRRDREVGWFVAGTLVQACLP